MRVTILQRVVVAGLLCGLVGASQAREVRVGLSEEYSTIQAGLDAAQPGDVVLVSPGFYEDFQVHELPSGEQIQAVAIVRSGPITIRGLDVGLVRIGPFLNLVEEIDGLPTYGIVLDQASEGTIIDTLSINHVRWAILAYGDVSVLGCRIQRCTDGVLTSRDSHLLVVDSLIQDLDRAISAHGSSAAIHDCEVLNTRTGVYLAVPMSDVRNTTFRGTQFTALHLFKGGSHHSVVDCRFENNGLHLDLWEAARAHLLDNSFGPGGQIGLRLDGRVTGERNVIGGATVTTIVILGHATLTDGVILNGGGRTIDAAGALDFGLGDIDLSDNWWGTTDLEQIDGWIRTWASGPGVSIEPIKAHAVRTTSTSMSRFRAAFGQR